MTRLLTFRFDDGFMEGARKAARILGPDRASYFIVGDRVLGLADLDSNPKLKGRNFGTLEDWREMALEGHDIQPHGYCHRAVSSLSSADREEDIRKSVEVVRSISNGTLVFSFPFNDVATDIDWASHGVAAAGFDTRASDQPAHFNELDAVDRYFIRSWAVREQHWDAVTAGLRKTPQNTWTVLALHSLDNEGFEPWSSGGFARLVATIRDLGFAIMTAQTVINRLDQGSIA